MGDTQKPASETTTLIQDSSDNHLITLASTGSGKSRSVIVPWLGHYPGAIEVIDPKGELAHVTARRRLRMGQRVLIFDPFETFHSPFEELMRCVRPLNPMQMQLYGERDLYDNCATLIEDAVGPTPKSSQDPFWRSLAIDLCIGLAGWVWLRPTITGQTREDDQTLAGVLNMLNASDLAYDLAVIMDTHANHPACQKFIRASFANFLQHESTKVTPSVRSEAVSLLRIFASPRVQQATASCGLPPDFINDFAHPTSVYLVFPPEKLHSHAPVLRIILCALLGAASRRRTRPRIPDLFVVDELAHLGPLPQVKQAITLMRGYGVRMALFLQSMAQLKSLWPQDYESILENCGTWLNFGNTTMSAAFAVADQIGDVSAEKLFAMTCDELALHRAGRETVIAQKIDYLRDPLYAGMFDPNPYYESVPITALSLLGRCG